MKTYDQKTKIAVLIVLTAFVTASVTTVLMYFLLPYIRTDDAAAYERKIAEITSLVDEYYIGEIDEKNISDFLAAGYSEGLNDKYSAYFTKENAEETLNDMNGNACGFGVYVSSDPDTGELLIDRVYSGGPAEKAGLIRYDLIVSVDGNAVSDTGYKETLEYIASKAVGDTVSVRLLRDGEEIETEIVIDDFETQSVYYENIDGIGLITITAFKTTSVDQFAAAIRSAEDDGVKMLVFDLRGNGGGMLDAVCKMLDIILPEGTIIDVKYKNPAHDEKHLSNADEIDLPMAVLTDENTASSSELFTQSLLDYGKAVSVGRKTFGKGAVQRVFELSDGSLIKFTVAKYYTVSGICVDGVGITPTIPVNWGEDELKYRLKNGISDDKDFAAAKKYLLENTQLS